MLNRKKYKIVVGKQTIIFLNSMKTGSHCAIQWPKGAANLFNSLFKILTLWKVINDKQYSTLSLKLNYENHIYFPSLNTSVSKRGCWCWLCWAKRSKMELFLADQVICSPYLKPEPNFLVQANFSFLRDFYLTPWSIFPYLYFLFPQSGYK